MAAEVLDTPPTRNTEPSAMSDTTEENGGRIFGDGDVDHTGGVGSAAAMALDSVLAAAEGREFSSSGDAGSSSSGGGQPDPDAITARIVATSNQLDEEPWLPVRNIVTMYRISCTVGEKTWEMLRRYSDFAELHAKLCKAMDPAVLPALPPKLLRNEDDAIAERYLELDVYLRKLLTLPAVAKHGRLLDFLGAEKHGVRYGVRRYEYDSAQSEGNKYIRDDQL